MMFYIRHDKTGLYMSGYCLWVVHVSNALPFSSALGVESVAEMIRRSGMGVTVMSESRPEVTVVL